LIANLKTMFTEVSHELKHEAGDLRYELSDTKDFLSDILGFEDQVKGFDMDLMTDDNLDFLDIYADFLGEEYFKMKESFQKAIATMSELYQLEQERARM